MPTDMEVAALWRQFSKEHYRARWIQVEPGTLELFRDWLGWCVPENGKPFLENFERKDLPAIREAHRTRPTKVSARRCLLASHAEEKSQALKKPLRAKAVSVASAIRDGTATAELVRSFLQEDIPPLDSHWPLPDAPPQTRPSEELAAEFKAASAFALVKGIGALMRHYTDAAKDATDEYLELRHRAEKSGLASCIISPPGGDDPLDPAFRDPPVELYRMIYLESIEDPIKQHRELWRFLDEDYRAGLVVNEDDSNWNYR